MGPSSKQLLHCPMVTHKYNHYQWVVNMKDQSLIAQLITQVAGK